ncbi:hypothetical protein C5B41_13770 [Acinetobacter ursingii]|uniref:DUF2528 family protein n=1 Tax=Acinetobacter ursingii TaxID=108980 RepID=UPI000CF25422|nr:DUF2528 family protein [Acinetobacter ursingii]PPZ93782.1 hypothetical protein C5B41_13770 [Acinetobacter ursingii]
MQHDSNLETPQAEIPEYLRCEPRTFKVKSNHWHEDVYELEMTVVIKCTDEMLREHNDFWSGAKDRLSDNENNITAVILKMIGRNVFWWCMTNHQSTSLSKKYGVNSIFSEEGWLSDCFEITKLYFENYVSDDDFEFESVQAEGATS